MASLDLSDAFDESFIELVTVTQRAVAQGSDGRPVFTPTDVPNVPMVICAASPNDLKRFPEQEFTGRTHSIVTQFRLCATAPGRAPDIINFQGSLLVVKALDNYSHLSTGFVQAIAESMTVQDAVIP